MCRHIGYIGNKKKLASILLEHKHSLIEMSYKPKEMKEATLNADGFGIAWLHKKEIETYKSDFPIWNDLNLLPITKSISSTLVIGNVRSATIGENLGYANTHPFKYKNFFFSHNGYIKGFNSNNNKKLLKYLDEDLFSQIKGNTDSEIIFFLILQLLRSTKDIKKSIAKAITLIKKYYTGSMLNFLLGTSDRTGNKILFATKYGNILNAPSLYYQKIKNIGYIISSEKLDDDTSWKEVKNNQLLSVTKKTIRIENII